MRFLPFCFCVLLMACSAESRMNIQELQDSQPLIAAHGVVQSTIVDGHTNVLLQEDSGATIPLEFDSEVWIWKGFRGTIRYRRSVKYAEQYKIYHFYEFQEDKDASSHLNPQ